MNCARKSEIGGLYLFKDGVVKRVVTRGLSKEVPLTAPSIGVVVEEIWIGA